MTSRGFTVVLIDSEEGSEGDFVYVEAFASADAIAAESERLAETIIHAARGIEERDAGNQPETVLPSPGATQEEGT